MDSYNQLNEVLVHVFNHALKIEENLVNNPALTVIMITHHLRDSIKEKLDGVLELS